MLGGINNGLFFKSFSGFIVVAVLALILRWAFSGNKSLIEKQRRIGSEEEYGLLKVAHSPKNHIKATLSQTKTGPKILVFDEDLKIAKATLANDK